jgi:hypothetical protein
MAQISDAPSHRNFSHFRCEEGVVTDINRKTWAVTVETRHTAKTVEDVQFLVPYTHFSRGEGVHHMPEVGAVCMLGWPSDNTPPLIMGYKGAAGVQTSTDDAPERPTSDPEGSATDVTLQAGRPEMNPGDIGITGRDENFLFLRRGGVLQLGATPISQRVYIPVLNYIRDYCENYSMETFGGDVSWTVGRQEEDPSGDAPASYVFHMNANAQDAKATVRVRYMALPGTSGGDRAAWEVKIAPQGVDPDTGGVTSEVYSLIVTTGGDQAEIVGASREVTIKGDDTLRVQGSRSVSIQGNDSADISGAMRLVASGEAVVGGSAVKLGSRGAASPAIKGTELLTWFSSAIWMVNVAAGTATVSPASQAQLRQILSSKVFVE